MKKILVVEDEEDIQELLCTYLCDAGYEVTAACDGVQAIEQFHRGAFDLVLLDIMLPKIDGFGVCEVMRRESKVPIMMLTALDGEAQPFSMPVFLRKVAAILRRAGGGEQPEDVLRYRELTMQPSAGGMPCGQAADADGPRI